MTFHVYIVTNRKHGTLYVGHTDDLARRAWEHRTGAIAGFSRTHGLTRLVYAEVHAGRAEALARERRLKRWNRAWKVQLIEACNPEWRDLYDDLN